MNLLYIIYITLLHSMIEVSSTDRLPPPLLEIVLRHVSTLLNDVKDKVAIERKLLSQLDDGTNKNTPVPVKNKLNQKSKEVMQIRTELDLEGLDILQDPFEPPHTEAQTEKQVPLKEKNSVVPDLPILEPDPFDDAIFNTPKPTTVAENIFDKTLEKAVMLSFMKNHNVGYAFGSIKGLYEMIAKKPEDLLEKLIGAFSSIIGRMVIEKQLNCLGALLTTRLKRLAFIIRLLPVRSTIDYSQNKLRALENLDTIYPEVRDPILKYDHYFTDQEGLNLLNSIVMLHNYNSSIEGYEKMTVPVTESYVNAVLAPTKRFCGSFELKALINEINIAYSLHYPGSRRYVKNLMNSTKENKTCMDALSLFRSQKHRILSIAWKINKTSTRSAVDITHDIYGPKPSESQKHIITLHGLLGSKRNWRSLCNKIADTTKATVIAADARNHGDSPHDSSHTYFDLASDASQLQNKLSLQKSHIIGHSMGGRTGMVLALTEPSKVTSLIVVDVSPAPRLPGPLTSFFPKLIAAMKAVNFHGADNGIKAKAIATETIIASGVVSDPGGLAFILMNIGELQNKTFGWKCNVDALDSNFHNISSFPKELSGKQYPGPTLFVGGGQSDYLPPTDEPAIQKFFPQAKLIYIDHVGHNAHAEDPPAFLKIVNEFYSKNL